MLIHIHTLVEDPDYNDLGFRASSVKNDMAALAEFFVSRSYVIGIAAYFRLASEEFEGIIKLLEVFVALPFPPSLRGEAANINKVFSGGGGEQVWLH